MPFQLPIEGLGGKHAATFETRYMFVLEAALIFEPILIWLGSRLSTLAASITVMDFRAGRAPDGSRDAETIGDAAAAPAIRLGDTVVFFEGREAIGFDRMKAKNIWQCRHGAFHHDDIVGKPFGSRVFSRSTKGYVYALSPTPELWSHVVPSRTQIVQDFDQSIVIFRLDLKPGDVVIESGTGSGVMSSSIMRTIAPSGFLHTFEFNEIRATRAQAEFEENSLGGLAKVSHRDVCAGRVDGGGFGEELDGKADAVFLDLPEPWLAVGHARSALKPGKKVCSYSPCIEQVMKTCEALRSEGFHSVTTIEFRLRNINYAEVQLELPDFGAPKAHPQVPTPSASSCTASSTASSTAPSSKISGVDGAESGAARANGAGSVESDVVKGGAADTRHDGSDANPSVSPEAADSKVCATVDGEERAKSGVEGGADGDNERSAGRGGGEERDDVAAGVAQSRTVDPAAGDTVGAEGSKKRPLEAIDDAARVDEDNGGYGAGRARNERLQSKVALRAAAAAVAAAGLAGRAPPPKLVFAQPFPIMRGHTAFLTFAATPVMRRSSPPASDPTAGEGGIGVSRAGADSQKSDSSGDVCSESRGSCGGGSGKMDVDGCEDQAVEGKGKQKEEVAEGSCVATDGR